MRKRKLLSTVVAAMLVATQITMPVMAATGEVDVDVSTKTPVLRVQVPTKLEVAVDEFETAGDGSQINSTAFDIKNFSTIPVYVKAESQVTPGSNVILKDTKDAVVAVTDGTGKGNAWLAMAAQIGKDTYGTIKDLTDASANVATIATTGGVTSAKQEFYLEKAGGNTVYKMLDTNAVSPSKVTYTGELFEMASDSSITDSTSLQTAIEGSVAVYAVTGETVTKVVSGGAYSSSYNYYKVATGTNAVTSGAATSGKTYVYAQQDTVGGETAFRFIGKLSTGKTGGWTKDDFTTIKIVYDINGVQASEYANVKGKCVYGLYNEEGVAPFGISDDGNMTITESGLITITGLTASKNYKSGVAVTVDGMGITKDATWDDSEWSSTSGGTMKIQLEKAWMDYVAGKTVTLVNTYSDGTTTTLKATFK